MILREIHIQFCSQLSVFNNPPYTLLVILEGVIVYYHTNFLE
jgi:hypothetical protein